jgi:hypothetical protein
MTTPGWDEYCRARVQEARESEHNHGPTLELTMLRLQHRYVYEIMDLFPDMDISVALRELVWCSIQADHGKPY